MSPDCSSVKYPELGFPQGRKDDKYRSIPLISTTPSFHELATILEALASSIRISKFHSNMVAPQSGNTSATAKAVYHMRRMRVQILGESAIADGPAWDILLDLFINSSEEKPVSVTSAAIGAHCPPTTALRWLHILEDHDLVTRGVDPKDKRRNFVKLSQKGFEAVVDALALYRQLLQEISGACYQHGPDIGQRSE